MRGGRRSTKTRSETKAIDTLKPSIDAAPPIRRQSIELEMFEYVEIMALATWMMNSIRLL
jgi:hypothetical protein